MITVIDSPACAGMELDIFITAKGPKAERAKAICAGCSSINQCLAFAMQNQDYNDVIYGGMTGRERKSLAENGAMF